MSVEGRIRWEKQDRRWVINSNLYASWVVGQNKLHQHYQWENDHAVLLWRDAVDIEWIWEQAPTRPTPEWDLSGFPQGEPPTERAVTSWWVCAPSGILYRPPSTMALRELVKHILFSHPDGATRVLWDALYAKRIPRPVISRDIGSKQWFQFGWTTAFWLWDAAQPGLVHVLPDMDWEALARAEGDQMVARGQLFCTELNMPLDPILWGDPPRPHWKTTQWVRMDLLLEQGFHVIERHPALPVVGKHLFAKGVRAVDPTGGM